MTRKQRTKMVQAMASDVRCTLERGDNVSISAFNFGLEPSAELAKELRAALPGVFVSEGYGFMGYMHFEKECGEVDELTGTRCNFRAGHVKDKNPMAQLHGIRGGIR